MQVLRVLNKTSRVPPSTESGIRERMVIGHQASGTKHEDSMSRQNNK